MECTGGGFCTCHWRCACVLEPYQATEAAAVSQTAAVPHLDHRPVAYRHRWIHVRTLYGKGVQTTQVYQDEDGSVNQWVQQLRFTCLLLAFHCEIHNSRKKNTPTIVTTEHWHCNSVNTTTRCPQQTLCGHCVEPNCHICSVDSCTHCHSVRHGCTVARAF